MGEVLSAFAGALDDQRRRGLPRMSVEQVRRIQEVVKVSADTTVRQKPANVQPSNLQPVAAAAETVAAQVRDASVAPSSRSSAPTHSSSPAAAQTSPAVPSSSSGQPRAQETQQTARPQVDGASAAPAPRPASKAASKAASEKPSQPSVAASREERTPAPVTADVSAMPWLVDESAEAVAARQAAKEAEARVAAQAAAEAAAQAAAQAEAMEVEIAKQRDEAQAMQAASHSQTYPQGQGAQTRQAQTRQAPQSRASAGQPAAQPAARAARQAAKAPQQAAERAPAVEVEVPALQNVPDRGAKTRTMAEIRSSLGDCTRCALSQSRTNLIFGEGDPDARLMIVGEAPSRLDDARGRLFSDEAGELLTAMLRAMGLSREQVYTTSILKCRPPNNRAGERDELMSCARFLRPQIETVQPEVILTLGSEASRLLLGSSFEFSSRRGEWGAWEGVPVMPTWHPGYLVHHPAEKRSAWADLQRVMERLGLRG